MSSLEAYQYLIPQSLNINVYKTRYFFFFTFGANRFHTLASLNSADYFASRILALIIFMASRIVGRLRRMSRLIRRTKAGSRSIRVGEDNGLVYVLGHALQLSQQLRFQSSSRPRHSFDYINKYQGIPPKTRFVYPRSLITQIA